MATTLEVLAAMLMAAAVGILELCVVMDRIPPNSKRYLWYLAPMVLTFGAAVAIAIPGVPEMICRLLCLSAVAAILLCGLKDEKIGFRTLHKTMFIVAAFCAIFGTMCWCWG